jgi:hypothetical protein
VRRIVSRTWWRLGCCTRNAIFNRDRLLPNYDYEYSGRAAFSSQRVSFDRKCNSERFRKIQACLSTVCAARHMFHIDGNLDGGGATVSHRAARHGDGCPECGLPLCSEKCWSCRGAASSWAYLCEECGGTSQLLLCPASGTPLSATAQPTGGRTIGTIRRGKPAIHLLQGLSRASLPARTILQHQSQQSRSHPAIRWLLWERELDPWGRAVEQTPVDAPQTLVNRHDPQNGEPHGERCPCHQSSRQS